jgi:hypothetical protein
MEILHFTKFHSEDYQGRLDLFKFVYKIKLSQDIYSVRNL